jgi:membrane-anchored protein YejM (alkaline phosphatase superfamily)
MYGNSNNFSNSFLSGFGGQTSPNPLDVSNLNSKANDLSKMYAELEMLKGNQAPARRTVFADIAMEMENASEDERIFIENSKEYISLNQQYQTEFSAFLIEKFGNEYASSKYAETPERILKIIKDKREEYKNKFAENLNEIKESNKTLINKNEELLKVNETLQKQLAEIQSKIGAFVL